MAASWLTREKPIFPPGPAFCFGRHLGKDFDFVEYLSSTQDLREAAANLYGAMRRLDEAHLELIVAEPSPRRAWALRSWSVYARLRPVNDGRKLNTRASGLIAVAVLCSRVLGLIREMLFAGPVWIRLDGHIYDRFSRSQFAS